MALVTIILMGVVLSEIDKEAERIGATVNEDAKVSLRIFFAALLYQLRTVCSPPLPLHTILLPIPLPTHHTLAHPPPATSPGLYHLSLLGVDISPGYLRHPAELIFI